MQPNQTPQPSSTPNEPQPTPTTPPASTPVAQPQPAPLQPASSAQFTSGVQAPTKENLAKQLKWARIAIIASFVIFVVGLFVGFAALLGAILGAYAVSVGLRAKAKGVITLGIIAGALNLIFYILAVIYG